MARRVYAENAVHQLFIVAPVYALFVICPVGCLDLTASPRRCTSNLYEGTLSTFQTCVTQPLLRRDEPDSHNWPLNTPHFFPRLSALDRTCNPAERTGRRIEFLPSPCGGWLKAPACRFLDHRNTRFNEIFLEREEEKDTAPSLCERKGRKGGGEGFRFFSGIISALPD